MCHLRVDVTPVAKGWTGGQEVEVLRDTGSSSAVVKVELVRKENSLSSQKVHAHR